MKLAIHTGALAAALKAACLAVPSRTAQPILNNLLLSVYPETDGGDFHLGAMGFDGCISVLTRTRLTEPATAGAAAVPAGVLAELVKSLPKGEVTLETTSDRQLLVSWTGGHATLPLFNEEDFPAPVLPRQEEAVSASFREGDLLKAIDHVKDNAAHDEMRPVLNGVCIDLSADSTRIVATDSSALAFFSVDDGAKAKDGIVVPSEAVSMLRTLLCSSDDPVAVVSDGRNVSFTTESARLTAALATGRYPRYLDVIPKDNASVLRVDRLSLMSAIRRVGTCGDCVRRLVRMTLSVLGGLEIEASDSLRSSAARETVAVDSYEGDEMTVGFRSDILMRILSGITSSKVDLLLKSPRHSVLITPVEDDDHREPFVSLVMPVSVA